MAYVETVRNLVHPPRLTQSDRELFLNLARQPEKVERLNDQLGCLEEITNIAKGLGLADDVFGFGGVIYPPLREARIHVDADLCIRGKRKYDELIGAVLSSGEFHESREQLLAGSSMKFIERKGDDNTGVIELRYVVPAEMHGVNVWKHDVPKWVTPLLAFRHIVIPDSAFSAPNEKIRIVNNHVRFIRPEYTYLIKRQSPFLKDQYDAEILNEVIDRNILDQIMRDIEQSGGMLILPRLHMTILHSIKSTRRGLSGPEYDALLNHAQAA